jgi:hypothetical protein
VVVSGRQLGPSKWKGSLVRPLVRASGLRRLAVANALAALVSLLWCLAYGRTSRTAWETPVSYQGDAWLVLATLKLAQDGHVLPFLAIRVPELGAPYVGNWNDFPDFLRQHKVQLWLAGRLARAFGLFAASNLLVLLAHVLAALSFYVVARAFRARAEWAAAGAVAFGFSSYLFYRSLGHLNLAFCWPVPLAILLVSWAFSRRGIAMRSRRMRIGLAIAAVTGLHNIYYGLMLAQFLALAGLAQLVRRSTRRQALAPWLLFAALGAAITADSANVLVSNLDRESGLARYVRPYGNLERYALKPIELVLPAPGWGRVPWVGPAKRYVGGAIFRGEMGSAYLGLAGIAAFLWMCAASFRAYLVRRRSVLPGALAAIAWILAYSVVGGLNGLVGTLGFTWLRGTNRYSVWILALVLLWAVGRLSRARWTRRRSVSLAAAALAAFGAFVDQRPQWFPDQQMAEAQQKIASDRTFAHSLAAVLPESAMLFVLPVVDCPEGDRVRQATDYESFRPYLYTRHLRFSYGSDKGRARDTWQRRAEALEPEALADALERIGFAGILVNRKAYDDGAQSLRERLAASGRPEAWESPDGDFLFVRLRPVANPVPPDVAVPETPPAGDAAR